MAFVMSFVFDSRSKIISQSLNGKIQLENEIIYNCAQNIFIFENIDNKFDQVLKILKLLDSTVETTPKNIFRQFPIFGLAYSYKSTDFILTVTYDIL